MVDAQRGVPSHLPTDLEPSGWSVLLVAISAIYWPGSVRLERDLGFLTALGTCDLVHLTGGSVETTAPSVSEISVSFHTIFFLLTIRGHHRAALWLFFNGELVYNPMFCLIDGGIGPTRDCLSILENSLMDIHGSVSKGPSPSPL